MPDTDAKLTPADPDDLAWSLAFALRFEGKKRWHDADQVMAAIVARRLIRHLDRSGFVVMKKPPIGGSAPLNPPPGWPHTAADKVATRLGLRKNGGQLPKSVRWRIADISA
jgi:hypothetical protein